MLPKLAIVIVNYNSYDYLRKCLVSILNGAYPDGRLEIIVVDNASTDECKTKLKIEFPRVRLIKNSRNLGFAKANNIALRSITTPFVLLLNPDTILKKDTLIRMIETMGKDKNIGALTCRVELLDGTLDDACHRGFPTPWNAFCHFTFLGKVFPNSTFFNGYHMGYKDLDKVHEIDSASGAFLLIRTNVGKKVDWLDEDYFWYGEDIDLCYRIKQLGYKIVFDPRTKIIHYKGVTSGIKKHSEKLSEASINTRIKATKARFAVMRIFYRKHYGGKYPLLIKKLVLYGIDLKERITLRRYQ